MVTEDYVSFEIAKLLKEKGFNLSEFHGKWAINYDNIHRDEDVPEGEIIITEWHYPLITLQMAMKWLREVQHIFIDIDRDARPEPEGFGNKPYFSLITNMNTNKFYRGKDLPGECASYEEACEAAIKYCLENLI